MDKQDVYGIIEESLNNFYKKRIEKLSKVDIFKIIQRKNPYMYRAFGTPDAHSYIESLLEATQASSDETIFGDFFETVAIKVSQGRKSSSNSIDLEIWSGDDKEVKLIAIKSGPHVFNAQSKTRQKQAFQEAMRRLTKVAIDPVVGYCYGRKSSSQSSNLNFREIAGQEFWEEITGDEKFYIKLIKNIGEIAEAHRIEFEFAWKRSVNKVYKMFMDVFGNDEGDIDWKAIVKYNSAVDVPETILKKITEVKIKYKLTNED